MRTWISGGSASTRATLSTAGALILKRKYILGDEITTIKALYLRGAPKLDAAFKSKVAKRRVEVEIIFCSSEFTGQGRRFERTAEDVDLWKDKLWGNLRRRDEMGEHC